MDRVETGVKNLDAIFDGGLPKGSVTIISGAPGSGKTILAQQICFHNATSERPVLYMSTLSEPTAKTLLYLQQFAFFQRKTLDEAVHVVDLGETLRSTGLESGAALVTQHMKRVKPAIVVIDSFKVFHDLARGTDELRKFSYELAVSLMAWETTALLLGEYTLDDTQSNPLFSIADGLVVLSQRELSGEQQRLLRVVKMRGIRHSREEHPFVITDAGIEVFALGLAVRREAASSKPPSRCKTFIPKLDEVLGPGIPLGSSFLIGGVAGTGKTVLSLEFVYRGALAGEKGIVFSFEETAERLRATAHGLGWDIDREIERGMIEIVFIPQPDIRVDAHLLMIRERIERMGARRVVIDSVSVFLHKVTDPQLARERIFHICTIVQNAQAVGFLVTDIPYGSGQISRFGVEETVVDGIIILSSTEQGVERQRYMEVYKLRNTAHMKGRHNMTIGRGGVAIFPRYADDPVAEVPPPMDLTRRIPFGVPGLDALIGEGLLPLSTTLLSGSAGAGKTTIAMQYLLEGARRGEPGIFVTLEEGPDQLIASAESLGLPLRAAVDKGLIEVLFLSRAHVLTGQLMAIISDRIKAMKAERLVIDAVTHMADTCAKPGDFHHSLLKLLVRFKALGVTTLLTLESGLLFSTESPTGQGLSPIADNVFMLRYARIGDRLQPTLAVIKTRGSPHESGIFPMAFGKGGVRIEPATDRMKR